MWQKPLGSDVYMSRRSAGTFSLQNTFTKSPTRTSFQRRSTNCLSVLKSEMSDSNSHNRQHFLKRHKSLVGLYIDFCHILQFDNILSMFMQSNEILIHQSQHLLKLGNKRRKRREISMLLLLEEWPGCVSVCQHNVSLEEDTLKSTQWAKAAPSVPTEPRVSQFEPVYQAGQPSVTESCRYAALHVGPDWVAAT